MGALREILGRLFKEDPGNKKRAELASRFRGKMIDLLGDLEERQFFLTGEQVKELSRSKWERPVNIGIRREPYGFRFEIATDIFENAFELHDNRPRIFETTKIGEGYSGYTPTEGNLLDQEIGWLNEWIGYATFLEGLQASSPASSASVS